MRFKRCRMLKYLAVKLAVVLTLIGVGIFAIHAGAAVPSDYWISLDEYDREVPEKINGWVFSNCGGDRGLLSKENIDLTWDNNSAYTVKRRAGSINPWGGMSYGLISQQSAALKLDFNALYGKYIIPGADYNGARRTIPAIGAGGFRLMCLKKYRRPPA